MFKKIDFCIAFHSAGILTLEYLIKNLLIVTTKFERLNIIVSYHDEEELKILKTSTIFKYIYKTVHAPVFPTSDKFYSVQGSYNHSVALKYLIKNIESEIVIISDQDIAILRYGWDEIIENNLNNVDIIATSYPNLMYQVSYMTIKNNRKIQINLNVSKYKKLPNLYFFCTKNLIIKNFFNNRLTNFDEYLSDGNLPVRMINTKELESETNLDLGSHQWLDTGYEIPEVIYNNKLSFITFICDFNQKILPTNKYKNILFNPEIFIYPGINVPFLIHFKKSSKKLIQDQSSFDDEFKITDEFLKNIND